MANIITGTTVINLDISIWTGKARLRREEVDDRDLPPEALVTMGSKKLFDPERLKVFHTLKANAFKVCHRNGVKFLGGWLVADSNVTAVGEQLMKFKTSWDAELVGFLSVYDMCCQEWLAKNAQWASILRSAMPNGAEIAQRFNFGWQAYNVVPAPVDVAGDQMREEAASIGNRAMEKLAREIADTAYVYEDVTKNLKPAPLRRIAELCRAVAFSAPEVDKLGDVLEALANSGSAILAKLTMQTLSDPKNIASICQPDREPEDILAGITLPAPAAEVEELVAEAEEVLQETPAAAQQSAVHNMANMIDSGGLW